MKLFNKITASYFKFLLLILIIEILYYSFFNSLNNLDGKVIISITTLIIISVLEITILTLYFFYFKNKNLKSIIGIEFFFFLFKLLFIHSFYKPELTLSPFPYYNCFLIYFDSALVFIKSFIIVYIYSKKINLKFLVINIVVSILICYLIINIKLIYFDVPLIPIIRGIE